MNSLSGLRKWKPTARNIHFQEQSLKTSSSKYNFTCSLSRLIKHKLVVYTRALDTLGNVSVNILTSKTEVASVKVNSMPRLDLCADDLSSKVLKVVKNAIEVVNDDRTLHGWTDSIIVLHWLAQPPHLWSTPVANRTSHIHEIVRRSSWNQCASTENPADLASTGVPVKISQHSKLWWNDPSVLALILHTWSYTPPATDELQEKRESQKISKSSSQLQLKLLGMFHRLIMKYYHAAKSASLKNSSEAIAFYYKLSAALNNEHVPTAKQSNCSLRTCYIETGSLKPNALHDV